MSISQLCVVAIRPYIYLKMIMLTFFILARGLINEVLRENNLSRGRFYQQNEI